MVGKTVHVQSAGPGGWYGFVRFVTGTVATIVDARGTSRMVDMSRTRVRVV